MKTYPKADALKYEDIRIGRRFSFKKSISEKDVNQFAHLTGDFNPLHLDESFARGTKFGRTIVHGMLAASLFSRLIGMHCPGKHALILTQEIKYIKPIRKNSTLKISGKVIKKIDSVKVLIIEHYIRGKNNELIIDGITRVKMMR